MYFYNFLVMLIILSRTSSVVSPGGGRKGSRGAGICSFRIVRAMLSAPLSTIVYGMKSYLMPHQLRLLLPPSAEAGTDTPWAARTGRIQSASCAVSKRPLCQFGRVVYNSLYLRVASRRACWSARASSGVRLTASLPVRSLSSRLSAVSWIDGMLRPPSPLSCPTRVLVEAVRQALSQDWAVWLASPGRSILKKCGSTPPLRRVASTDAEPPVGRTR